MTLIIPESGRIFEDAGGPGHHAGLGLPPQQPRLRDVLGAGPLHVSHVSHVT